MTGHIKAEGIATLLGGRCQTVTSRWAAGKRQMLIDLSHQNEGDGRGFQPVEPCDAATDGWDNYFRAQRRWEWLRNLVKRLIG